MTECVVRIVYCVLRIRHHNTHYVLRTTQEFLVPSLARALLIFCLAVAEATPAALALTILSVDGVWSALCAVAVIGAIADAQARRLPPGVQRPALLAALVLTALGAAEVALPGPDGAPGVLLTPGHPERGDAYLLLLGALYAFWRGTQIGAHNSYSLRAWFPRAAAVALGIIIFGLAGGRTPEMIDALTLQVIGLFAAGLTAIALAGIAEVSEAQLRRIGTRGAGIVAGAVVVVLLLGLASVGALGGDLGRLLGALWQGVAFLIGILLSPFLIVLFMIVDALLRLINVGDLMGALQDLQIEQQDRNEQISRALGFLPPWLIIVAQAIVALLPVLVIIALVLWLRRRPPRSAGDDEERESLFTFAGLIDDLRDLLAGLRPAGGGLVELLGALRGDDAVQRIRRAYVRLLILGEQRGRPRAAAETPREYAAAAGEQLPGAAAPIESLTGAYERARYYPADVAHADADAAEQAWDSIEKGAR
jgi:hypothetical protein